MSARQDGKPAIKILVGYHKPGFVLQNSILQPIHLGRAVREEIPGQYSAEEKLALASMPGDDTGENISAHNRRYSELTGMYWAWKNYAKLGNPDYFGLLHYRRLLDFSDRAHPDSLDAASPARLDPGLFSEEAIQEIVPRHDICIRAPYRVSLRDPSTGKSVLVNVMQQYATAHNPEDLKRAFEITARMYPEYQRDIAEYSGSLKHCLCNIFVMKKVLFFHFAKWLFSILSAVDESTDYSGYSDYQKRLPSFLSERLAGLFFHRMANTRGVKLKFLQSVNIDC